MSGPPEAAEADGVLGDLQAPTAHEEAPPAGVAVRQGAVAAVFDVRVELPAPHALVILREVDPPHRQLSVPVALGDAGALAHAWRELPAARPLTHQLFADVLVRLGATIDAVRLIGRRAGVVLAELELTSPRGHERIDCRPTDALTLALRQGVPAPILVDERLFEVEGDVEPSSR